MFGTESPSQPATKKRIRSRSDPSQELNSYAFGCSGFQVSRSRPIACEKDQQMSHFLGIGNDSKSRAHPNFENLARETWNPEQE